MPSGSRNPTFQLIGSEKIWERGAALTSRLQSFETDVLTQEETSLPLRYSIDWIWHSGWPPLA